MADANPTEHEADTPPAPGARGEQAAPAVAGKRATETPDGSADDPAAEAPDPSDPDAVHADGVPGTGLSAAARAGTGRLRRTLLPTLVAFLLVLGPAAYLAVSADQSHDPLALRRQRAEKTSLVDGRPASVQRRIYQVPLPADATAVAFHESNSWQTSALYVRFTTTPSGLTAFLHRLRDPGGNLPNGHGAVTDAQARTVGWNFQAGHHWAGVDLPQRTPAPGHRITVGLDDPAHPTVYVVATVTFR